MAAKKRGKRSTSETAQNAAVDTAATAGKVTGGVVTAAAIGLVKGISRAVWRSVRPRR